MLGPEELRRYARHLVIPEVGQAGQERLAQTRVLCVGAGGLGSPLLLYLAAAGVGTIGIVEGDLVDESNLQRQILYGSTDVGSAKIEAAAQHLYDVNPFIRLELHPGFLDAESANDLVPQYDIVADGTDNFAARYLINDACVKFGKPNVHASVFRFEGQLSVFDASHGPCYRCVFPTAPEGVLNCAEAGVLGVLPGVLGSLQALEVIKLAAGIGEPLVGRILTFDGLVGSFRTFAIRKNPECPVCSIPSTMIELQDSSDLKCEAMNEDEVTPMELAKELASENKPVLVDVREDFELDISRLPFDHHIPLGALTHRFHEIDPEENIVIYCRSGARSGQATEFLRSQGFKHVRNMVTGMNGWANTVDPTTRKY